MAQPRFLRLWSRQLHGNTCTLTSPPTLFDPDNIGFGKDYLSKKAVTKVQNASNPPYQEVTCTAPANQYKVMFCRFPGGGVEHADCTDWVVKTAIEMKADPRIGEVRNLKLADTPITMTRNAAVKAALEHNCDYILMVDSDMCPDLPGNKPFWKTAWDFMMARRGNEDAYRAVHGEDGQPYSSTVMDELYAIYAPATIAAPYCGPPPMELCYVFEWKSYETDGPDPNYRLEMIGREASSIRTGIQEVAALPTGLILYDARVFRKLPPPWFRYEWADKEESEKASTEDVYQTRNASLLGMPQFVTWDCWAGHIKTKIVKKPSIMSIDDVHSSLVEAVQRGWKRNTKVLMVGEMEGPGRGVQDATKEGAFSDDQRI